MSPERPVYRVTVKNDSQGWTHTIEHRETPPDRDDATLLLIDDFSMGWALEGDQVPAKLAADTVNFKFWARTAAYLPAIEVGDVLLVDLDRPGPDDELIPYMHFQGRASEPSATAVPGYGIELAIAAAGFLVDLSDEVDLGNDSSVTRQTEGYLMSLIHDQAGVSTAYHDPSVFTRNVRAFGKMSAQEGADRLITGAATADGAVILRSSYKWITNWAAPPPAGYGTYQGDNADLVFYLQRWLLDMPAPLSLIADDVDPDMVTLGPDDATLDKVATIPAGVCNVPATWSKSRADLVNVLNLNYTATSGTDLVEGKLTTKDAASVARYGPAPRDISTFIFPGSAPAMFAAYANPAPGTLAYSIESLEVLPEGMADYQLDELAPTFYPHAEPIGSTAGRFIILTDLDEDTAVAGRDVAMQIIGATFSIAKGRLVVKLNVRAVPAPSFATAVSWADLAASPHAAATWTDSGTKYIDPALDWDELTYTDA